MQSSRLHECKMRPLLWPSPTPCQTFAAVLGLCGLGFHLLCDRGCHTAPAQGVLESAFWELQAKKTPPCGAAPRLANGLEKSGNSPWVRLGSSEKQLLVC